MTVREWFRGMRSFDTIGEQAMLNLAIHPIDLGYPATPPSAIRLRSFTFRGVKLYASLDEAQRDLTADDQGRRWRYLAGITE